VQARACDSFVHAEGFGVDVKGVSSVDERCSLARRNEVDAVGVVMVLGGHGCGFLGRVGRVWTRQLRKIGSNEAS
jgi:hypothetical protein